jgi:hypothetical protein
MENSFESQIYFSKVAKAKRVPTLKSLVTKSIESSTSMHSISSFTQKQVPKESPARITERNNNYTPATVNSRTAKIHAIDPATDDENQYKGSAGDVLNDKTQKYLVQPQEIDVGELLVTVYEKGSEWIQAGALMAYNIFREETDIIAATQSGKNGTIEERKGNSEPVRVQALPVDAAVGRNNNSRNPADCEPSSTVSRKTTMKNVAFQEQRSAQTSAIEQDTDDTIYYNGYCARVRGKGIMLEAIFVNGVGPSQRPLEIRVRLQLPPPEPGVYGQLVREYRGKDDKTLHLSYSHGPVEGTVDILCPPEFDPRKLECAVMDDFLIVTSP